MSDRLNAERQALLERIERLETSQRRLRRTSTGLGVLFVAAGLMSFALPAVCRTLKAERFILEDGDGRDRVVLNAYGVDTPTLTLQDEDQEPVAELFEENGQIKLKLFGGDEPKTVTLPGKGGVN